MFACQIRTAQVFVHSAFLGSEVTCLSTMAYDPSGHIVLRWYIGDSEATAQESGVTLSVVGAAATIGFLLH